MTKIFFDTEFTGLHQATTLMSIGLIDEFGDTFYAELTDYDESQVNDWLRDNVLAHFKLHTWEAGEIHLTDDDLSLVRAVTMRGTKAQVRVALTEWLANSEVRKGPIQIWSDCLAYDWVLFNDLLADYSQGYPQLPANVHYIPMDICTMFQLNGIDPDVSREEFSGTKPSYYTGPKHNALHDARVIKDCYYKLLNMPTSRHTFARLDTDTAASDKKASSFDAALNIALEPGYVTPVAGNVAVGYTLPATGVNKRLGGFVDGSTGAAVSLLYNSEGAHRLVRYDPLGNGGAGSETTLLEWAGLNFSADLVPQGGILDGLLVYKGADGELRCVNLARAAAGGYTAAYLAAEPFALHLLKVPPTQVIAAVRSLESGVSPKEALRIIQGKAYQFSYRYRYVDGEQTVQAPFSPWLDVLTDPSAVTFNTITLTLPAEVPAGVQEVELLVREAASADWQIADTLRRSAAGVLPTTYRFYGQTLVATLTPAEADKEFESLWPCKVATLAHGRVVAADFLEGYPTPEPAFTAVVENGNAGSTTGTLYTVVVTLPGEPLGDDPLGLPGPDTTATFYYTPATGSYPDATSTYFLVTLAGGKYRKTGQEVTYAQAFTATYYQEKGRAISAASGTFTADSTDLATFHENSSHRVAVQFYDALGRPYGCSAPRTVSIPKQDLTNLRYRSIRATLTTTDADALNAEIPAGAYSCQFVVAPNDRTAYFLQGRAADVLGYIGRKTVVNTTNGNVEGIEQFVDALHNAHQKLLVDIGNWPAAGIGYEWTAGSGDVLRFLQDEKEFVITGQRGDYLEIAWDGYPTASLDAQGRAQARIEIYTPSPTQSGLYYERGPRLAITRTTRADGTEQRGYQQASVLLEGDCFLVELAFPIIDRTDPDATDKGTYFPPNKKQYLSDSTRLRVESMVPPYRLVPSTTTTTTVIAGHDSGGFFGRLASAFEAAPTVLTGNLGGAYAQLKQDFTNRAEQTTSLTRADTANRTAANLRWLDMSYSGRPAAQVPLALQQVRRASLLRFGGVKVAGTQLNGLSQWEALSQYGDLPQEQGAVTSLTVADQTQTDGSILLATQERGAVSVSLGRQQVQTADGQALLAITSQVLGSSNALRGGYGCVDPGSVVAYAGKVFYYCRERQEVVRYDRNGNSPLGLTYKARTRLAELAKRYAGGTVRGCYHPYIDRKEYWLTFEPVGNLPGTILVYSDLYEAFADRLAYAPEAGLACGAELLTWQDGALYRHTPDAPAATFCGVYTAPTLTFTVAQPAGVAKQFKDVALESASLWLPTATATDTGLNSLMRAGWFTYREGIWRGGQRRATNSPGFPTPYHALDGGKPLVGATQTLTLTAPEGATALTAVQVSWIPRSGQTGGV